MRRIAALLLASVLALPTGVVDVKVEAARIDPGLTATSSTSHDVIVSFDTPPSRSLVATLDTLGTVHHVYGIIDAAHVTLDGAALDAVARLDDVTRIDQDEALEWHLDTSRPAVQVDERLWRRASTGANATIAVVDTGIDSTHPSVQGRVQRSVTFTSQGAGPIESATGTDSDGHGTHVAGIAAGSGANSKLLDPSDDRYAGIAPSAGLVSLDISASFTTSTAIRAFEWIHDNHEAYGIEVVQNSWGRKETGQAFDEDDPAVRASDALAIDDDLVVVFSAANEGPERASLSMEAMNPNVLTVGATDDRGQVAEFSSRGPVPLPDGSTASWTKPDVVAPGVAIRSAASSQDASAAQPYKGLSGTSQAAPHVAGIAALIRDQAPDLPALQIIGAIERSARDLGPEGPDPTTGYGLVRAPDALEVALNESAGSLSSDLEVYTAEGRLVVGAPTGGLLPEDTGAESQRANGTIPVQPASQKIEFRFDWRSPTSVPPPDLTVRLTDPAGRGVLVPTSGTSASRTLEAPVAGTWSWEATPASSSSAGVADYQLNATVTLASQERLTSAGADDGGYFDEGVAERTERAFHEARETYGDGLVYAALAVAGLLVLGLIVRGVRRAKGP